MSPATTLLIARALFAVVLVFQAADGWTTYQTLRLKRGYETNPRAVALMERFGVYWGLMILKGWVTLLAAVLLFWVYSLSPWWALIGLASMVVTYTRVVVNNFRVLYPRGF